MKIKTLHIIKFLFLLFIVHWSLIIDNCMCQWVQQTLPVTGSVYSIVFFDQNTGLVSMDTQALLRTSNGGNNWTIIKNLRFGNLKIVNDTIVYALRSNINIGITGMIYRSFNRGVDWDSVAVTYVNGYMDMFFPNKDTGLIGGVDGSSVPNIWKTTNGGLSLFPYSYGTGMGTLFFLNEKVNGEYYGWNYPNQSYLYSTTNSGLNWQIHTEIWPGVRGLYFLNKDTGWVANENGSNFYINFTTNGGINWSIQNLPYSNTISDLYFSSFNKGWVGSGPNRIYVTTNGGQTWGWQYTPTANAKLFFLDSLTAWSGNYANTSYLNHTTNGGGIINQIANNKEQIANEFKLYQNYPNPFNQITIINVQLSITAQVKLDVYEITGKLIKTIVNNKMRKGSYEFRFDGGNLSSGVYFYSMYIDGIRKETKKMILNK